MKIGYVYRVNWDYSHDFPENIFDGIIKVNKESHVKGYFNCTIIKVIDTPNKKWYPGFNFILTNRTKHELILPDQYPEYYI